MTENHPPKINLSSVIDCLGIRPTKAKKPQHSPEKQLKLVSSYALANLFGGSLDAARKVWAIFVQCLVGLLTPMFFQLLDESRNADTPLTKEHVREALDRAIPRPFSGTTLRKGLPKTGIKQVRLATENLYWRNLRRLKGGKAREKSVILAVDDTTKVTTAAKKNRYLRGIFIASKNMGKKGFQYTCIYDATHKQVVSFSLVENKSSKARRSSWSPLVESLIRICEGYRGRGIRVEAILVDRGFYSSELLGAAHCGILDGRPGTLGTIPIVVPKKGEGRSRPNIWGRLIRRETRSCVRESMTLSRHVPDALKSAAEQLGLPKKGGSSQIPLVKSFLTSSSPTDSSNNLRGATRGANQISDDTKFARARLNRVIDEYKDYAIRSLGVKRGFNPKKPPKRRVFKTRRDRALYNACMDAHKALGDSKKRKQKLLGGILVTLTSNLSGNGRTKSNSHHLKLASWYRERWAIENMFRDCKQHFLLRTNLMGPRDRLSRWLVAFTFYNAWQLESRLSTKATNQTLGARTKLNDPRTSCLPRRGKHRIRVPLAQCFLASVAMTGFTDCL